MLPLGPHPTSTHRGHWFPCLTLHHLRLKPVRTLPPPWEEQPEPHLGSSVGPQTLVLRGLDRAEPAGSFQGTSHQDPGPLPSLPEPLEPLPSPCDLSPSIPFSSLSILQASSSCDRRTSWDIIVPRLTGKNCSH